MNILLIYILKANFLFTIYVADKSQIKLILNFLNYFARLLSLFGQFWESGASGTFNELIYVQPMKK